MPTPNPIRALTTVVATAALGLAMLTVLGSSSMAEPMPEAPEAKTPEAKTPEAKAPAPASPNALAEATFAGGCFWCMEGPFDELDGVVSTTSGYTGGTAANPTYEQVSGGRTGHTEAVRVVYDPARIDYARLLEVFWVNVDPLTSNRQFCDGGSQYRSGIFVHDAEQRRLAEVSKAALETSGRFGERPIVTEITEAATFYPAEEYHQDYYRKNPLRYSLYRRGCGRDARLKKLWGDAAGH